MTTALIVLFTLGNLLAGLLAARYVRNAEDYLLAGRRLPFYLVTATLFATWFGSETILGASSEFAEGGLLAVVRDPFGAALCLLLVGLWYARPLYRMQLLTLGDFFRERYGSRVEKMASWMIILPYLSWIAAQFVAFGIIMQALTGLPSGQGFLLAGLVVTVYTFVGGMWSVAVTDFLQMLFILLGLAAFGLELFLEISPLTLISSAPEGFFRFIPEAEPIEIADYVAAWITIGLGSIAGQDIFQRVMASRNERTAIWSPVAAGLMYLSVGLVPLLMALAAKHLNIMTDDPQLIVPQLVAAQASPAVKILFFAGLLSAIMSTASSALLAPAAILSENILRPEMPGMSDRKFLNISRMSVLFIALVSVILAWTKGNVYALVGQAASLGLVTLFVPLTTGLFTKTIQSRAAIASMLSGLLAWLLAIFFEFPSDPVLYGLSVSFLAIFLPEKLRFRTSI
ncbi:MAG: sodium:solute symporter family protein [Bacteroidetes bacterium]|nr:sodium:solute symporter family protein [Bacteroidota bacterium]